MILRISSALWLLVGLSLCVWSAWGLATQEPFTSTVVSWCIGLTYGVIAFAGGAFTLRSIRIGWWLLVAASCVALLYAAMYWFFGGTHDAPSYLPGVIGLAALSTFTLILFLDIDANAT